MQQHQESQQQPNIDNFINDLAVAMNQQRGIQFKSLKEATEHTEQTTQEIRYILQQNSIMLKEGLRCFSERCSGLVADISKRLLDNLQSHAELTKIIETEIQSSELALQAFSEAANSFYDCGDYHLEQCVLSAFMMLFPLHPQPYACYATLIWRKEGITAAETFYAQLVDSVQDPVLDYFAADCFAKAGNEKKAKELIQRALEKTQTSLQEHHEIRQHLLELSRRFH